MTFVGRDDGVESVVVTIWHDELTVSSKKFHV